MKLLCSRYRSISEKLNNRIGCNASDMHALSLCNAKPVFAAFYLQKIVSLDDML